MSLEAFSNSKAFRAVDSAVAVKAAVAVWAVKDITAGCQGPVSCGVS